jgi:hypothetical protein
MATNQPRPDGRGWSIRWPVCLYACIYARHTPVYRGVYYTFLFGQILKCIKGGEGDRGGRSLYLPDQRSGQHKALSQVCQSVCLLVTISQFKELRLSKVSNAAICYMLYAICYMLYARCYMLYAICYMIYDIC